MKYYGIPNTAIWFRCAKEDCPSDSVEIPGPPPPGGIHIIDISGDWILPSDLTDTERLEIVRLQRRAEYMTSLPLLEQIEALMEASMGHPKKLEEMQEKIRDIRQKLPYPKQ
jgi:hypothetical protein